MLCHQVDPPEVPCRLARRRQDNHILLLATAQGAEHGATVHQYRVTDRITGRAALASGCHRRRNAGRCYTRRRAPPTGPGCPWPRLLAWWTSLEMSTLYPHSNGSPRTSANSALKRSGSGAPTAPTSGRLRFTTSSVSVLLGDAAPRSAAGHRWPWHPSPRPSPRRNCGPPAGTAP